MALEFTERPAAGDAEGLNTQTRGVPLMLYLQMGAAHLFDAATGLRLEAETA